VRPETIDRFCETYARYGFQRKAFCPSYGGAEATVYMSSGGHESEPLICHVDRSAFSRGNVIVRERADASTCDFVGCGPGGPGLTLLIVDPDTMLEAAPNKLGEIWAKGPNIGHGYWGKPELTQEAFGAVLNQPRAGLSAGPYFRTGDMGFQYGGQLFVAGRMNEIIHVRGRKLFPGDLERTAGQTCDLLTPRGGAAFMLTEGNQSRVVLVHELEERSIHATDLAPALHQALFREHEIQLDELVLIRRNALLKTSSGKPRRLVVRDAYRDGKMKVLSSWRRS
jgi:acyl-CoA synthetase (AMP-forming)/AMP-acid ligase II